MKVRDILLEYGRPWKGKALWGGNTKSGAAKYGKKVGSQTLPGYSRAGQSGQLKIKPRPKKNLWFQDQNGWYADLRFERGNFTLWKRLRRISAEEEEETLFAGNEDGTQCFGYWCRKTGQGMTFHKPKSFELVKRPNDQLEKLR